jgi:hypothetical protein
MKLPSWLRPAENLSGEDKAQQMLAMRVLRITLGFMLAIVIVYGGAASIAGSGLFLPRTAKAVLESAEMPENYAWTSESIRRIRFPGRRTYEEQSALRSAVVDLKANQFQTVTAGVLDDRTILSSDGRYAVRVGSTSQNWELVTNVCEQKPTIPASTVRMPEPSDLVDMSPRMLTDQGSILNQQAWVIGFRPTSEFLRRLFWLPFWDAALPASERRWALSAAERDALQRGRYVVEDARAWVARNKPRYLYQYDVRVRFTNPGGSTWRFLVKFNPQDERLGLTFGDAGCDSGVVDADDAIPTP